MEVTFHDLKQKDVINLTDGKNMGKVCDLKFTFPENDVLGFTVTGGKGFKFTRQEVFVPVSCVVKIGADAVLVKIGKKEERKSERPPQNCPPPPFGKPQCPPQCPPPNDRRSYDEYE